MKGLRRIVDIHAHILPGTDDGARTMEEAAALVRLARQQGVVGIIATPHGSRRRTMVGGQQLTEALTQEIQKECPAFFVFLGQENYYHDELAERLRKGEALTLAESDYVLVEFPEHVSYAHLFQGIRRLALAGYHPVLAHVERYDCLRKTGLEELSAIGCLHQMNFDSLCGSWFQEDVRWCRRQVLNKRVHVLATDMHRMEYRPPRIDEAWRWLEAHVSQEELERMTYQTPLRILERKIKDR